MTVYVGLGGCDIVGGVAIGLGETYLGFYWSMIWDDILRDPFGFLSSCVMSMYWA